MKAPIERKQDRTALILSVPREQRVGFLDFLELQGFQHDCWQWVHNSRTFFFDDAITYEFVRMMRSHWATRQ